MLLGVSSTIVLVWSVGVCVVESALLKNATTHAHGGCSAASEALTHQTRHHLFDASPSVRRSEFARLSSARVKVGVRVPPPPRWSVDGFDHAGLGLRLLALGSLCFVVGLNNMSLSGDLCFDLRFWRKNGFVLVLGVRSSENFSSCVGSRIQPPTCLALTRDCPLQDPAGNCSIMILREW